MVSWKLVALSAAAMVVGAGLNVAQTKSKPVAVTRSAGPAVEVKAEPAERTIFSPQVATKTWTAAPDPDPVERPKRRKKRRTTTTTKPAEPKQDEIAEAVRKDIERINREKEKLSEAVKREIQGINKNRSDGGESGNP